MPTSIIGSNCLHFTLYVCPGVAFYVGLRSALYARNPVRVSIKERLDAVHKAQQVDKHNAQRVGQ